MLRGCGKAGGAHGISLTSRASARLPDSKLASNCKDAGGASIAGGFGQKREPRLATESAFRRRFRPVFAGALNWRQLFKTRRESRPLEFFCREKRQFMYLPSPDSL